MIFELWALSFCLTYHMINRSNPFLFVALVAAFVFGSVAGGVVGGYFGATKFSGNGIIERIIEKDRVISADSARAVARAEEEATIQVVEQATSAVVSIIISKEVAINSNPFIFPLDEFGFFDIQPAPQSNGQKVKRDIGAGTGFVVSTNGLIVTNKHVVNDEKATYTVVMNDGKKYDATVLARDPVVDVAVVKIEATGLTTLEFGDSDKIRVGQTVIAIGNALSEFQNSVTKGVISGLNRRIIASGSGMSEVIEEALQTDAAINPGNSGGPLLDLDGRIIGMNTAVERNGQLIGFAIPSNVVKRIAESVEKHGRIIRPWLGVRYILLNSRPDLAKALGVEDGALILSGEVKDQPAVVPGSPAEKAGLLERDLIVKVGETPVNDDHSLSTLIAKNAPSDMIELTIRRNGNEMKINVTLGEFDEKAIK